MASINDKVALMAIFEAIEDDDCLHYLAAEAAHQGDDILPLEMIATSQKWAKQQLFNHRIQGFVMENIPKYNDPTFKVHFRMQRSTFESLLEVIMPHLKIRTQDINSKVLSVIWLLSNEESYRGVADRFDMSKGSLHFTAIEFFRLLSGMAKDFITWPDPPAMQNHSVLVEQRYGFPGVVGFVDGSHIQIKGKSQNRESYINRMGYSSILLQAVCDIHLIFTHCVVGWPGSVHDARVFRNSNLENLIGQMSNNFHILGDSAYPISLNLMTPFRDNGHLTQLQKKYNNVHGTARSCIERAFALLKGKFRRLKYLDMCMDAEIPNAVSACLVLHNFILKAEKQDAMTTVFGIPATVHIPVENVNAITKRNNIAASL